MPWPARGPRLRPPPTYRSLPFQLAAKGLREDPEYDKTMFTLPHVRRHRRSARTPRHVPAAAGEPGACPAAHHALRTRASAQDGCEVRLYNVSNAGYCEEAACDLRKAHRPV